MPRLGIRAVARAGPSIVLSAHVFLLFLPRAVHSLLALLEETEWGLGLEGGGALIFLRPTSPHFSLFPTACSSPFCLLSCVPLHFPACPRCLFQILSFSLDSGHTAAVMD
eukprot:RCo026490